MTFARVRQTLGTRYTRWTHDPLRHIDSGLEVACTAGSAVCMSRCRRSAALLAWLLRRVLPWEAWQVRAGPIRTCTRETARHVIRGAATTLASRACRFRQGGCDRDRRLPAHRRRGRSCCSLSVRRLVSCPPARGGPWWLRWGGGRHRPASAGLVLERAVAGCGLVDPGGASGGHVEVGLDHGDRRGAFVAGDVHVPEARIEEAGAGRVPVRRARRVVAVVDGEGSPDDDDEGRAGV